MKIIKGDLFEGEWDGCFHCCNLFSGVWGSGFVIPLKKRYPEALEADQKTIRGDTSKLGTFSCVQAQDGKWIFNLYGQMGIGNNGDPLNRNCRYDAMFDSVYRVCEFIATNPNIPKPFTLACPYLVGCDRAGGEIEIVKSILESVESMFASNVKFAAYQL